MTSGSVSQCFILLWKCQEMETAQLHWSVRVFCLLSTQKPFCFFFVCYLLFSCCVSLERLALSSWHLWERYVECTGWLLLQSFKTTSPSDWRGSVFLTSSHSPRLTWCPFTKIVLFICAFPILNVVRGRDARASIPKALQCKDDSCALSLLTSVHSNTAEGAVASHLFPGHASVSCFGFCLPRPLGHFSAELLLGWAVPTVQHQGLFLPVQKTCPAEFD